MKKKLEVFIWGSKCYWKQHEIANVAKDYFLGPIAIYMCVQKVWNQESFLKSF